MCLPSHASETPQVGSSRRLWLLSYADSEESLCPLGGNGGWGEIESLVDIGRRCEGRWLRRVESRCWYSTKGGRGNDGTVSYGYAHRSRSPTVLLGC